MYMSSVYFVGDLHLGHRSVLKHTTECPGAYRGGTTVDEHDEWVLKCLLSVGANKRTMWYILGDVAMDAQKLELLRQVPGRKVLVMGNHDKFDTEVYLKYFERVQGGRKHFKFWMTHMPMHPAELAGHPNVHGHCHRGPVRVSATSYFSPAPGGSPDPRYLNVAIDWLPDGKPLSLEEVRERLKC